LLVLLGHAGGLLRIGLIDRLDAMVYDMMLRVTMPGSVDERIVIVDIDERSLAEMGHWPWPRDRLATLLDKLFDRHRVALTAFDIVFAEPDDSAGVAALDALATGELRDDRRYLEAARKLRPQLDRDARFEAAMRGRPVVLGYYLSSRAGDASTGTLPLPTLPAGSFGAQPIAFTHWTSFGGNLRRFQEQAPAAGHFNPMLDVDGVTRRVPMLVEYGGDYYESLSLATVRTLLGGAQLVPVHAGAGFGGHAGALESLELRTNERTWRVPVDDNVAALVPFRGGPGSFPSVSAADVLAERIPADRLAGKVVLVGTTALGLMDLRATPVGVAFPGVEMHANLIAGMLDGKVRRGAALRGIGMLLLCGVGAVLVFFSPRLSPLRASLLAAGIFVALAAIGVVLWQFGNVVLPLAAPLLLVAALHAINMSFGYFVESRAKRQFARLFGQYVPPELVAEMARHPGSYSMAGRKQELTVLFADIRGFTAISERLEADRLAALMNEYLGAMTDVIRRHRGTLDKYIGDAIMAFWGAPVADPRHAVNAVRCALDMQAALTELNRRLAAEGWPALQIGIGINTGVVAVGDMGSAVRKAYTAIGDAVNLAARLEGVTKEYGVGIILTGRTRDAVADSIVCREIDRIRVKGRDEVVTIFEPVATTGDITERQRRDMDTWQDVLAAYRARDWPVAAQDLARLAAASPQPLWSVFAARVARWRAVPPPPDWDGVWVFENK
jgi:adenylate cyclase